MDKTPRRHQSIVAVLLLLLALEEMVLYPKSYLASWAVAVVLFGVIYWFIAVSA